MTEVLKLMKSEPEAFLTLIGNPPSRELAVMTGEDLVLRYWRSLYGVRIATH